MPSQYPDVTIDDSIRVLLVEDDEPHSVVLRDALAAARPPIEMEHCRTLREAIAHLEQPKFDAVLLNLDLPDSQGLQTIDRALAEIPGLPIVVITAAEESDLGVAAVQHGAQDYLAKSENDPRYLSRVLRFAVERAGFQTELAHRERHFRALIEHAHDMVVLIAPDGVILYQSPATQRILGYPPEELAGTNVLELIHPVDRSRAFELLATWPAIQYNDEPVLPFRIRHKDGSWREVEALGQNLGPDPGMVWSSMPGMSPSESVRRRSCRKPKRSCGRCRRWTRSDGWPAALPTTSTTSSPRSTGTPISC